MATELEIRVTAELREIKAALAGLGRDMQNVGKQANTAGAGGGKLASSMKRAGDQTRRASKEATGLQRGIASAVMQAKLLVGGLGIAALAKGILGASDTTKLLAGQLKLVTKTTEEFNKAQAGTFAIAQRTRQGLEGTVNLYARIARSGKANQQQTLALTESINQAVALSFTTAQAGEAALFQLGQGLGSGVLRGEELNSVLEQTPRLATAIAEGLVKLGKIKDPGDLREYARKNGIAAKLVVEAIATQQAKLRDEFGKLPPTVAQAMTKVHNSFLKYIGDSENLQTATDNLARKISTLADNLATVADGLLVAAQAAAAFFFAFRLAPGLILALAGAFVRVLAPLGLLGPGLTFAAGRMAVMRKRAIEAAIAVNGFSLSMTGAQIAAGKMGTKLIAVLGVVAAAFAGWQIGKYLVERFLKVKLAGIALAQGLTKAAYIIAQSFRMTGALIYQAYANAFNKIKGKAADLLQTIAKVYGVLPGLMNKGVSALAQTASDHIRKTITANKDLGESFKEMRATAAAELARIDLEYGALADAAIDAHYAAQRAAAGGGEDDATATATDTTDGDKKAKHTIDQLALIKDAAERALVALDHLYEDGKISVADYYAEKIRLQQASIDADIMAAQSTAAAAKGGSQERADALTQIIILERQRRDVAIEGARDQLKAEEELIDQLGRVKIRLLELDGQTARARSLELELEFENLLKRLDLSADVAGKAMVRKLINVEAAKAGLDQLKTEFSDVTGALSQLQQTTSAQVSAGLLSNSTAEKRVNEARAVAIEQLRTQRDAVAALYAEYKDPAALLQLQALDEQIAQLSISTDDWRGKLQDASTGALTTFFKELADGSTTAGEAVRNLAVNFTQALAAMAAQALAKKAISAIFDAFSGGGGEDEGAGKVASAAAAGLAYAAPVSTAAGLLTIAGGTVSAGAVALTASAAALQAAATTLLIANSVSIAAAHSGGVVGALYQSRNVNPAVFTGAPRYHSGGVAGLKSNEVPAVLLRGEEVLTREDPRHRDNGGRSGNGGGAGGVVTTPIVAIGDDAVADAIAGAAGERVVLTHVRRNWQSLNRGNGGGNG